MRTHGRRNRYDGGGGFRGHTVEATSIMEEGGFRGCTGEAASTMEEGGFRGRMVEAVGTMQEVVIKDAQERLQV